MNPPLYGQSVPATDSAPSPFASAARRLAELDMVRSIMERKGMTLLDALDYSETLEIQTQS